MDFRPGSQNSEQDGATDDVFCPKDKELLAQQLAPNPKPETLNPKPLNPKPSQQLHSASASEAASSRKRQGKERWDLEPQTPRALSPRAFSRFPQVSGLVLGGALNEIHALKCRV